MALEIILPERTPALEWIMGRAVAKVSPGTRHSLMQGAWYRALDDWSARRYLVGTEWRFRLAPPGEVRRPLVPDVAVVPRDGLRGLEGRDREGPPFGPLIVVEILSPRDEPEALDHKRRVYFACGTLLMLIVDPPSRVVDAFEHTGSVRRWAQDETLSSPSFPDMAVALRGVFAALDFP